MTKLRLHDQPKFIRGGLFPSVMNECFDEVESIQDELRRWAVKAGASRLRVTSLYHTVIAASVAIDRVERITVPSLLANVGVDYKPLVVRWLLPSRVTRRKYCLYLFDRMIGRMTELAATRHESAEVKRAAENMRMELVSQKGLLQRVQIPRPFVKVDKSSPKP